jgi:hypothetical protein
VAASGPTSNDEAERYAVSQAYEERLLFLLLLLRQPRLRLVYLTSVPVPAAVIDYYLGLSRRHPEPFPGSPAPGEHP